MRYLLLGSLLLAACESKKDRLTRLTNEQTIACLDARYLDTDVARLKCENATEELKKALK